ncbi:thiamine biosynthesis protein ThiS [Streptomyces abyssalis]|uniref:Thiamine biosynthesis protein ThiS n=1 Tax=Streptomyces abyssalis TaxID=933944 RepID=A0A1E7JJE9_9ACTN|nr:MoaD/ThiS family protein [Streptomyces abyssalis]OEU87223.1 thiamine biosynthesis protein ThiS [Streptomyces abyssalis]OEU87755.1 thiamine biosynthesis protein ThiS [Streptomyces abyssalis]OEV29235.1 thiamine biosynthesis protein ThiS [Streptomyces nanshensis]
MAIEVRIPTILRTYTDGEKAVSGEGGTLKELFDDLESRHAGIQDRLVDGGELRRFVNVYLNDEDVRFLDGISTKLSDGDSVTILPAVAGGAGTHARAGTR